MNGHTSLDQTIQRFHFPADRSLWMAMGTVHSLPADKKKKKNKSRRPGAQNQYRKEKERDLDIIAPQLSVANAKETGFTCRDFARAE